MEAGTDHVLCPAILSPQVPPRKGAVPAAIRPEPEAAIVNFTYLVGVIVVSHFGVTAATEITQIVKGSSGTDSATTNADTDTQ